MVSSVVPVWFEYVSQCCSNVFQCGPVIFKCDSGMFKCGLNVVLSVVLV